jgi:chitodextrinase/poly(3-hydroxybutyrate) depolymerase
MKRTLLLTAILVCTCAALFSQNVFDPADPIVRYNSGAQLGTAQNPDPSILGLQKWVSVATNGVSTGSGSWDASSYKAYYILYGGQRLAFRLKFPKTFNDVGSETKKYPLMMFFHGAGEVACSTNGGIYNNEKQLAHGANYWRQRVDANQFEGFLLYPQLVAADGTCWGSWGSTLSAYYITTMTVLDSLIKYVRVDADRVSATGLSGGGIGAWRIAEFYPQKIAATAPSAAAGLVMNYTTFVHIPVWFATGGRDTNPSPAMAQYSITQDSTAGAWIKYTQFPTLGHSVWNQHWALPGFVQFLSDAHKANPLVFFQRSEFCPGDPINTKIGITQGFYAYEWQKDEVTIATRTNGVNTIIDNSSIISFEGNNVTVKSFGTYRVRFKRTASSDWSVWSPKPAVIQPKAVTQTPPIQINGVRSKVLPALDGSTQVPLLLPSGFLEYEWRRVSDNVLVSSNQTFNAPVGEYKAKYTEPFGCGTEFSPVFKVVNANSTPKPDAAKNLSATAVSQTVIQLDWNDNPNAGTNETGFEIYRSEKAGGPYEFLGITAPNIVTYTDQNLIPNRKYYYVVRAVAETGAAAASNESSVSTLSDNLPPSAPANLQYRGSNQTTVYLRWTASTDNIGVARYDIYVNGTKLYTTKNTSFAVSGLDSLTEYNFTVKALDKAGNVSPASNQVSGYTHRQGFNYKYYNGSWSNLPDFNALTPDKTGIVDTVDNAPGIRTSENGYGLLWEGFVYIPVTGTYTFETNSDDGSKLYIDMPYSFGATALVNNDGAHGAQSRTGSIYLTRGYHSIAVTYFEASGGDEMHLWWSSNVGIARERIPKSFFAFESYAVPAALQAPSNLVATPATFSKINLTWIDNSNNETGFEIVRGTSVGGTFAAVATVPANTVSYTDSLLNPATRYFYKIRAVGAGTESPFAFSFTEANWRLNNNYTDANGNANRTLAPTNTTFNAADKQEGSHALAIGNNQYASVNNSSSGGFPSDGGFNQRSVGLWIKPTLTNSRRMIFDFGGPDNGLALRFNSDNLIAGIASGSNRVSITLNNFVNNANWVSGGWNHVAIVYDVTSFTLYLNGVAVAQNNSLPFSSIAANSSSSSRIGNTTTDNAFNDGSYSTWQGLMDNIFVVRGALTAAEVASLMTDTYQQSAATTLAAPGAPAAPSNLNLLAESTDAIQLTWNDNSGDETGFEIWRSAGNNTTYRLIASVPAGTNNYADTGLFANATYFYKVRATGLGNPSGYTPEKSAKTLNSKPVIKNLSDFTMRYNTTVTLPLVATDVDGDPLTFTASNLPDYAVIQNINNGNANLVFNPRFADQGGAPIEVYVDDSNGGRDTTYFSIVVNENSVPVMSSVSDMNMQEGSSITVPITVTDGDGDANFLWYFEGLPSFVNFFDNGAGSASLQVVPGYASSGVYPVGMFVDDGYGAWTSREFIITVQEKEPDETVQLNFRNLTGGVALWNDIQLPALTYSNIRDTKNAPSPIGINLVSGTISASQQGTQTGNNTGVYPDAIMRDLMVWGFNTGNNNSDVAVLRVTGLDVAKKYNFVFFGSYNCAGCGTSASITTYKVGTATATVRYYLNTTETDTIYDIQPNSSGEVLIEMTGDANTNRGGVLNSLVIKAVYDDGTVPAKPLNLAGEHSQNKGTVLTWEDRSYNESTYEVYRSETKEGPYTLLNSGQNYKDSTTYIDASPVPFTEYFYYVVGVNGAGTGITSDTVQLTTGNNMPLIAGINELFVKTDAVLQADFTVTDDAGDNVTVSVENQPAFITLEQTGPTAYRITASPTIDNLGWLYLTIRAADDKGGVATKVVPVTVSDKHTRSVYIKLGNSSKPAPQPWNNWLGVRTSGNILANLKDEQNVATTIDITSVNSWKEVTDLGHITGNNSGVYPDSVLSSGLADDAGNKIIRFDQLNPAKRYNVVFVGSQNEGGNAMTEYFCGLVKDTLNARYNTTLTANLNGLVPSVSNQLVIEVRRINSSPFTFLNAVILEEYDPTVTLLNPVNLRAEPIDKNTVLVTWSDRTNNEAAADGYMLERASDSLFTQNLVQIALPWYTTSYTNTGLTPNTKYWYRVRAHAGGGLYSDYSNRAKTVTPASIIYVNFNYTVDDAAAPWNNLFAPPTTPDQVFSSLKNQSGIVTGLSLTLEDIFNGEFNAGHITGNNSGVVPDNALAANYWLDNSQVSTFRVSGLNHSRRYRFGFFGSAGPAGWFKGNYTATYTINDRTVYLNSWMNTTKVVYLGDVVPDENGEVLIKFSTTATAAYGFNGGVIIHDYNDAQGGSVPNAANFTNQTGRLMLFGTPDTDVPVEATVAANANARMYPNPFSDFINLDFFNKDAGSNVSVDLYDLSGRLAYRRSFGKLPAGFNTLRISAAEGSLKTGVYVVSLNINGKSVQANKMILNKK